ncbi:hypothetical protein KC327_g75 [Hortaea werneckii]|nr:hypothetical protein KC327_g75 [Hortaea werneckii]
MLRGPLKIRVLSYVLLRSARQSCRIPLQRSPRLQQTSDWNSSRSQGIGKSGLDEGIAVEIEIRVAV